MSVKSNQFEILFSVLCPPGLGVQLIPGQIILVKQVNIHVYSVEVRYVSLMSIVNPLHARAYWPFQDSTSFADPVCYLCFMLVFAMLSCLFLAVLCWPDRRDWPLVYGVFLCFCCLPRWCPRSEIEHLN